MLHLRFEDNMSETAGSELHVTDRAWKRQGLFSQNQVLVCYKITIKYTFWFHPESKSSDDKMSHYE